MSERFFLAAAPVAGRATLSGEEARHLARVLRAKPGDRVTLFDGQGQAWAAHVTAIGRSDVELEMGESVRDMPRRGPALTIAVALPKGDRQKWLVEKLTELGVDRLVPLSTERGVAEATRSAIERLERGVIEACKQCGRNSLMTIREPGTVADFVKGKPNTAVGILTDPRGQQLVTSSWQSASEVIALVGPEGGFTDAERSAAEAAGFQPAALAPHILRIETAALALAATWSLSQLAPSA